MFPRGRDVVIVNDSFKMPFDWQEFQEHIHDIFMLELLSECFMSRIPAHDQDVLDDNSVAYSSMLKGIRSVVNAVRKYDAIGATELEAQKSQLEFFKKLEKRVNYQ